MEDRDAITVLVSDLHWQIAQMKPRGIKDSAGNPYNPSYYKRGLKSAIQQGGPAVVEYVRGYVYKTPSGGYKKLEAADSLDLACEALVADEDRPYAHLFTDADREAARARLAPRIKAIEARKAATRARIDGLRADLPGDLGPLRELSARATDPEDAVAINAAILLLAPNDAVAMNRLGRAYEAIGNLEEAERTFRQVVATDPNNAIAVRRLRALARQARR